MDGEQQPITLGGPEEAQSERALVAPAAPGPSDATRVVNHYSINLSFPSASSAFAGLQSLFQRIIPNSVGSVTNPPASSNLLPDWAGSTDNVPLPEFHEGSGLTTTAQAGRNARSSRRELVVGDSDNEETRNRDPPNDSQRRDLFDSTDEDIEASIRNLSRSWKGRDLLTESSSSDQSPRRKRGKRPAPNRGRAGTRSQANSSQNHLTDSEDDGRRKSKKKVPANTQSSNNVSTLPGMFTGPYCNHQGLPNFLLSCKHLYCEKSCTRLHRRKEPCPRCKLSFRAWQKVFP